VPNNDRGASIKISPDSDEDNNINEQGSDANEEASEIQAHCEIFEQEFRQAVEFVLSDDSNGSQDKLNFEQYLELLRVLHMLP
jgi:hypothetical protein